MEVHTHSSRQHLFAAKAERPKKKKKRSRPKKALWWAKGFQDGESKSKATAEELESEERTIIEYFAKLENSVDNECTFLGNEFGAESEKASAEESEFTVKVIKEVSSLIERSEGEEWASVVFEHPDTSRTLEKVLQLLSAANLRRMCHELLASRIPHLCRQKCASHLVQSILCRAPRVLLSEFEAHLNDSSKNSHSAKWKFKAKGDNTADAKEDDEEDEDSDDSDMDKGTETEDASSKEPPLMSAILCEMMRSLANPMLLPQNSPFYQNKLAIGSTDASEGGVAEESLCVDMRANGALVDVLLNAQSTYALRDLLWVCSGVVWRFEDRSKKERMSMHNVKKIPSLVRFSAKHVPSLLRPLPLYVAKSLLHFLQKSTSTSSEIPAVSSEEKTETTATSAKSKESKSKSTKKKKKKKKQVTEDSASGSGTAKIVRLHVDELIESPALCGTLEVLLQCLFIYRDCVKQCKSGSTPSELSSEDNKTSADKMKRKRYKGKLKKKKKAVDAFDECAKVKASDELAEGIQECIDDLALCILNCRKQYLDPFSDDSSGARRIRRLILGGYSSRLLQCVFEFASQNVVDFLMHRFLFSTPKFIVDIATHASGNHVLQSLLRRVDQKTDAMQILKSLTPVCDKLFEGNKIGVISALIDACNRSKVDCSDLVANLIVVCTKLAAGKTEAAKKKAAKSKSSDDSGADAMDADATEEKQEEGVELLEYLLTLVPTKRGKHKLRSGPPKAGVSGAQMSQLPEALRSVLFPNTTRISTVGCVLLQSLLHCSAANASVFKNGLLQLGAVRTDELCRDAAASHVIQAFVESVCVPHNDKWKLLQELSLAHVAITKCGNFVVESAFRNLLPKWKRPLAQALLKGRSVLTGTRLGLKTDQLMRLNLLQKNSREWNAWMTRSHKDIKAGISTKKTVKFSASSSKTEGSWPKRRRTKKKKTEAQRTKERARKRKQKEMKKSDAPPPPKKTKAKKKKAKSGLLTAQKPNHKPKRRKKGF